MRHGAQVVSSWHNRNIQPGQQSGHSLHIGTRPFVGFPDHGKHGNGDRAQLLFGDGAKGAVAPEFPRTTYRMRTPAELRNASRRVVSWAAPTIGSVIPRASSRPHSRLPRIVCDAKCLGVRSKCNGRS